MENAVIRILGSMLETQKRFLENMHDIEMNFHALKTINGFDFKAPIKITSTFEPL